MQAADTSVLSNTINNDGKRCVCTYVVHFYFLFCLICEEVHFRPLACAEPTSPEAERGVGGQRLEQCPAFWSGWTGRLGVNHLKIPIPKR